MRPSPPFSCCTAGFRNSRILTSASMALQHSYHCILQRSHGPLHRFEETHVSWLLLTNAHSEQKVLNTAWLHFGKGTKRNYWASDFELSKMSDSYVWVFWQISFIISSRFSKSEKSFFALEMSRKCKCMRIVVCMRTLCSVTVINYSTSNENV